jgi:hypothetical protein
MKQNQQPAAEPATAPRKKSEKGAPVSPLAAAFDAVAQKSGFTNWKELDREQPLPTRSTAPVRASIDPDAKPEPPKISNKQAAAGQTTADVSFSDFVKGAQRLPAANKRA